MTMDEAEGKSILLVEDEALIALLEQRQLEKRGYTVRHVFRGEDAVKAVLEERDRYDVILMDIDLGSGIDGTEASEMILAERDIPIIFLSSHVKPEIVEKTEKISSYGYLVKNSGEFVLDASIKMALKLFAAKVSEREKENSLAAMAHILDVAPSSVTVHSKEGHFLYANKKTCELHGYSLEEFLKINLHDLDVPETEALLEERIRRIEEEGRITFEAAHFRKDRRIIPLMVTAKTVDWRGEPAILSIAIDITERKIQEEALRRRDEQIQALLSANPDIMFIFSRDGRFIDSKASAEHRYLVPPDQFLGSHVLEVLPEDLARLSLEKLKELFETGQSLSYEYHIEKDETVKHYETRLVPCGRENALAIVRDITDQKKERDR